jgi:hypothetical protein
LGNEGNGLFSARSTEGELRRETDSISDGHQGNVHSKLKLSVEATFVPCAIPKKAKRKAQGKTLGETQIRTRFARTRREKGPFLFES